MQAHAHCKHHAGTSLKFLQGFSRHCLLLHPCPQEKECENRDNTDEDCWYPKNMEELVTVDEVGGEDDCIVEPDLPELDESSSGHKEPAEEQAPVEEEQSLPGPTTCLKAQEMSTEVSDKEKSGGHGGDQVETPEQVEDVLSGAEEQRVISEPPIGDLSEFPSEEFKAALEETCPEDNKTDGGTSEEAKEKNHVSVTEESERRAEVTETIVSVTPPKNDVEGTNAQLLHQRSRVWTGTSCPAGVSRSARQRMKE